MMMTKVELGSQRRIHCNYHQLSSFNSGNYAAGREKGISRCIIVRSEQSRFLGQAEPHVLFGRGIRKPREEYAVSK